MASKFITVSIEIMHDTNLSPNQKFILAEIEQLCSLERGCFASNKHFSELIGITKQGASKAIQKLQTDGYIHVEIIQGSRNTERIITLIDRSSNVVQEVSTEVDGVSTGVDRVSTQVDGGINSGLQSKENRQFNKQENIQIIPAWVDTGAWARWVRYRQEIKKPLSPTMVERQLSFLSQQQHLHVAIIDQSIRNGWTGLFEVKGGHVSRTDQNMHVAQQWANKEEVEEVEVIDA